MPYSQVPDLGRVVRGVIWGLPPTMLLTFGIATEPLGDRKEVLGNAIRDGGATPAAGTDPPPASPALAWRPHQLPPP